MAVLSTSLPFTHSWGFYRGRVSWELASGLTLGLDRSRRDQIGGQLVMQVSDRIVQQAGAHRVDATVVAAILRHEGVAFERRLFTLSPTDVPGLGADAMESFQVALFGDTASIGPGQMQLRRARELESLGYVSARSSDRERVSSLLDNESSVEYVTGMVRYLTDQLGTVEGFGALNQESQRRLILIGYNTGWERLREDIGKWGLEDVPNHWPYDNQTLDEYLRWLGSS